MNLLCGATNAFLADFTNILITGFVCFALFVGLFRKLYHDELAMATILCVQLHDSVGSSGGTGEEVENNITIFYIRHSEKSIKKKRTLWIIKNLCSKELPQFLCPIICILNPGCIFFRFFFALLWLPYFFIGNPRTVILLYKFDVSILDILFHGANSMAPAPVKFHII